MKTYYLEEKTLARGQKVSMGIDVEEESWQVTARRCRTFDWYWARILGSCPGTPLSLGSNHHPYRGSHSYRDFPYVQLTETKCACATPFRYEP